MTWYTIKELLGQIIGNYTPVLYNNETYVDYPYIMGCILFILIVYLFIKFIMHISK